MGKAKVDAPIRLKTIEGAYHETHNEPDKAIFISERLDWLDEQLKS